MKMKNTIKTLAADSPAITMDHKSGVYFIRFDNGTVLEFGSNKERTKTWNALLKAGCTRDLNLSSEEKPATFSFQIIEA